MLVDERRTHLFEVIAVLHVNGTLVFEHFFDQSSLVVEGRSPRQEKRRVAPKNQIGIQAAAERLGTRFTRRDAREGCHDPATADEMCAFDAWQGGWFDLKTIASGEEGGQALEIARSAQEQREGAGPRRSWISEPRPVVGRFSQPRQLDPETWYPRQAAEKAQTQETTGRLPVFLGEYRRGVSRRRNSELARKTGTAPSTVGLNPARKSREGST